MNIINQKLRKEKIEPIDRGRIRETILLNDAIKDFTKGVKEFG